jgi:hypothetical protein
MQLPQPVTIQPPPVTMPDGTILNRPPLEISAVNVMLIDSAWARKCEARISHVPATVTLWEGDEYDAAGDYTQAEAEARLLEKLGPDIKAGIEALFVRP